MLETLAILAFIFVPGAIPVYCAITFFAGMADAEFEQEGEFNSRWQVYSCHRFGVRFYKWINERVR
jgi:hypothetical protein